MGGGVFGLQVPNRGLHHLLWKLDGWKLWIFPLDILPGIVFFTPLESSDFYAIGYIVYKWLNFML